MRRFIIFLDKDLRTGNRFAQVVAKTYKKYSIGDYLDIKLPLEDNQGEWVLAKVIDLNKNVIKINIVGDIR